MDPHSTLDIIRPEGYQEDRLRAGADFTMQDGTLSREIRGTLAVLERETVTQSIGRV